MKKLNYLNLGCGKRYHTSWTNVDFVGKEGAIIGCNLISGIPFEQNTFDLVYHSHVLEHFSKSEGRDFLKECFRVTKVGGIIRIAVPDLERIVVEYHRNLQRALNNDTGAEADYDWIMLELYDQVVRNQPGGEMAKYLFQDNISNENYVYERIGEEGRELRRNFIQHKANDIKPNRSSHKKYSLWKSLKGKIYTFLLKSDMNSNNDSNFSIVGKFRLGGEIHQWMYDRYSLTRLLTEIGFREIKVCSAFDSRIPNWNDFQLESKDGVVFKPDSLFIEAIK